MENLPEHHNLEARTPGSHAHATLVSAPSHGQPSLP